jgi:hypothetical protein
VAFFLFLQANALTKVLLPECTKLTPRPIDYNFFLAAIHMIDKGIYQQALKLTTI